MVLDYSIIVCTYNPDERILSRCLRAISALDMKGLTVDIILVDNNSLVPVESLTCVKNFKTQSIVPFVLIHVKEQGVGHARIAAIERSAANHIIYFDFDNEPEPDYLQQLKILNTKYPKVAAWGPGSVLVDFIDGIDVTLEHYARIAFQEKNLLHITYANIREWQECYPFGTGLCTASFVLKEYIKFAKEGKYTMQGRKGNELTGGEDTQMVLHAVLLGYAAGSSPYLKLNHIIPENRANIKYLRRFAYHVGLDYQTCRLQLFPEQASSIEAICLKESKFASLSFKKWLKARISSNPLKILGLLEFLGFHTGAYRACNKSIPEVVFRIIKNLKAE